MIGKNIWKYRIVEFLGSGGSAQVYKAIDERNDREIALKVLPDDFDKECLSRFKHETRAIRTLDHPNIIKILDIGTEGKTNYYAMEFIPRTQTLKEIIRERYEIEQETIETTEAVTLALGIAEALAYIHDRGILHRDIKPGNILVTAEGRPILMDFGLAKIEADPGLTLTGTLVGTPLYMAPEQIQGTTVDHRTDLYQLGIVLYKTATGKVPFEGDRVYAVAAKRLTEKIPPPSRYNPLISSQLERVILRLTQRQPADRYATARDLVTDLQSLGQWTERAGDNTVSVPNVNLEQELDVQANTTPGPQPPPSSPVTPATRPTQGRLSSRVEPEGIKKQTLASLAGGAGLLLGIGISLFVSWLSTPAPMKLKLKQPKVETRVSAATIRFETELPMRTEIAYGEAGSDLDSIRVVSELPVLSHEVVLDALAPGRAYESRLRFILEDGRLIEHPGPAFRTHPRGQIKDLEIDEGALTDGAVNRILEAMKSSDWQARLQAIHVLKKSPTPVAQPALLHALEDSNNEVRLAAYETLGTLLRRAEP